MQERYDSPLISIIIVNFNGLRFLEPCLSSLTTQSFRNFEIIIVDNHSSDGSARYLREHFPLITLIETVKNLGFAGGTNTGIRASHGDFILTLNNDTITDPQFIENLARPMTSDPHLGMCASKMVFPDGRINSTAICISRSGAAWDRGMGELDHGQYDEPEEIFGPCAGRHCTVAQCWTRSGFLTRIFFSLWKMWISRSVHSFPAGNVYMYQRPGWFIFMGVPLDSNRIFLFIMATGISFGMS